MNNIEKAHFERLKYQYENAPQDKDGIEAVCEFVIFLLNQIETHEAKVETLEAELEELEKQWDNDRDEINGKLMDAWDEISEWRKKFDAAEGNVK